MRSSALVLLIAPCISFSQAWGNPVSFKGGYGVMPAYNRDWHDVQVNYSLSNHEAIGVSSFYRDGRNSRSEFGIGQYNQILRRWNESDAQANVNASIGFGGRHDSVEGEGVAAYGALEGDYETRRVYGQLSAETLQSKDSVRFSRYRGRMGIAPYLASFESLQTWLVLQVDYMPEMDESLRITPMGRFFYGGFILEAGVSLEDSIPFVAAASHF
jgi:hypothetical protein